ncbi:MAG TPA: hypothetical protein ENK85_02880 [Saprospiraceae bacterium]|nr:hypothetical protein [Saprospiraceae bacterium]
MAQAFIESPVLLLFVVAAIGYWLGTIRIKGFRMGVAAILFVGLAFGGTNAQYKIPEVIIILGLTIFVYSIGLKSGPTFFSTFRQRGIKDIYFIVAMLTVSAGITVGIHYLFGFDAASSGGIFAGSSTNTPALAGLLDVIRHGDSSNTMLSQKAVIGYSLSYPVAIFGAILAIVLAIKVLKIDFRKEEEEVKNEFPVKQEVLTRTIEVTNPDRTHISIRDIKRLYHWKVVFGRVQRVDGVIELVNWDSRFHLGDKVAVIGNRDTVEEVVRSLGKYVPDGIQSNGQSEYVTKRIFVSNVKIAGERLATLNLNERFAAIITRIRRNDIDLLPNAGTTLELGDQVQFIARRRDVNKLSEFFGDSFEALGKINLLSFGLGMALGLLLGMVTIELPGSISFKLGFAGGPIIVALILGALRRTGPIVWILPHSANTTLQQIGLILLLSGIGVNSGHTFFQTIVNGEGAGLKMLAALMISFLSAFITLIVGYKYVKIPFSILVGMMATQPAILEFAIEKSENKLPVIGYAFILPIALIIKVLYVQILYLVL